jgi:ATP/maltotriose-dependent transcriptional regulator MalT
MSLLPFRQPEMTTRVDRTYIQTRDRAIMTAAAKGASFQQLAQQFSLALGTIKHILRKETRLFNEELHKLHG